MGFFYFTFHNFEKPFLHHRTFLNNIIFTSYLIIFYEKDESKFNYSPTAIVFYFSILLRVEIGVPVMV